MATLNDLLVTGSARFVSPIIGTITNAVNATNATNATTASTTAALVGTTSTSDVPKAGLSPGYIKYFYNVNTGLTGNMPTSSNANGILQFNTHSGNYHHQLGLSSDGNIYYRSAMGVALDNNTPWWTFITAKNYSSFTVTLTHEQEINGKKYFLSNPEIRNSSYPSLYLVHNSTNDLGYRTNVRLECNSNDIGEFWVNSYYGSDSTYRRAISLKGFANSGTTTANCLALRECDGSGIWSEQMIYHSGNIVYSAQEPANPVPGMIWLKPV